MKAKNKETFKKKKKGSRPITEVKQRRARLVLGWVTAWEPRVSLALFFHYFNFIFLIVFYIGSMCNMCILFC